MESLPPLFGPILGHFSGQKNPIELPPWLTPMANMYVTAVLRGNPGDSRLLAAHASSVERVSARKKRAYDAVSKTPLMGSPRTAFLAPPLPL